MRNAPPGIHQQASPNGHGNVAHLSTYLNRNLTDVGNAQRLVSNHGQDLRYCHPWKKWLVWDGKRWAVDATAEVERRAVSTVASIYGEAADDKLTTRQRQELATHAKASESKTRLDAMIALARSMPGIPVLPDDLDQDPWSLNTQAGTIDLRTGQVRPHTREDLITKITPVEYNPQATAPTFDRFLAQILPSEAVRGFLQRAIGYSATGSTTEEMLPILHGSGANGKTTLTGAIMDAMGDYAMQAAPALLMAKQDTHPTELADLFGARFVVCTETEEGRRLAESLVKFITGRDRIRARRMREDFWEFDPTHTVFLGTNHRPEVRGTDHAIWRRLKLVPFDVTILAPEQDKQLPEKLRAEAPGILAWIVRGCLAYQRDGLGEPEQVMAATEGYRTEMDTLAAFFEDCCVIHENVIAPATPLYQSYVRWCEENGESADKQRRFGLRLRERGFVSFTYKSGPHKDRKGWAGIGLRDDQPDPDAGGGDGGGPDEPDHSSADKGWQDVTADDQTLASTAKQDRDANKAAKSGTVRQRSGPTADDRPLRESTIDKPDTQPSTTTADDSGPKIGINSSKSSRVGVMRKVRPLRQQGPLAGENTDLATPGEDGAGEQVYKTVADLFADPPSWLPDQLRVYDDDPRRHFGPLCTAVAAVVLNDGARGDDLADDVRAQLEKR